MIKMPSEVTFDVFSNPAVIAVMVPWENTRDIMYVDELCVNAPRMQHERGHDTAIISQ